MKIRLLALSFFVLPILASAFELRLQGDSLDPAQKSAAEDFLVVATHVLPKKLKDSLSEPIAVSFSGHAKPKKNKVSLERALLNDITDTESQAYRRALGALVRRVAFLYDDKSLQFADEAELIKQRARKKSEKCRLYSDRRTTVSSDPNFLNAAGWVYQGSTHPKRQQANRFFDRTPEAAEKKGPQYTFVVNFDLFLNDPEFSCRRPIMHQYFQKHFQHKPFADPNCKTANVFQITGSPYTKTSDRLYAVDPNRLYEVHYFYAGKGPTLMNNWGHSMLRLVFCAPETPMGPGCLKDIQFHVILSYRAFMNELSTNYLGMLSGHYPTLLYAMAMPSVLEEYRQGEMREVQSLPLKLTREELMKVYYGALEAHWAYEGAYKIIDNNCVTETVNLLRTATNYRDRPVLHSKHVLFPETLFKFLGNEMAVGDASVFQDKADAEKKTYYFPQRVPFYVAKYDSLRRKFPQFFKNPELGKYLNETKAEARKEIAEKVVKSGDKESIGAMLILERLIAQRLEKDYTKKMMDTLAKNYMGRMQQRRGDKMEVDKNVELAQAHAIALANPARNLTGRSYGIPLLSEAQAMEASKEIFERRMELYSANKVLQEDGARIIERELQERDKIKATEQVLMDGLIGK